MEISNKNLIKFDQARPTWSRFFNIEKSEIKPENRFSNLNHSEIAVTVERETNTILVSGKSENVGNRKNGKNYRKTHSWTKKVKFSNEIDQSKLTKNILGKINKDSEEIEI